MNKTVFICAVIAAISVLFCVVGIIVLPENVVVQVSNFGEPTNIFPKALAIALPMLLSFGGCYLYWRNQNIKSLLIAAVGIIGMVLTIIFNI